MAPPMGVNWRVSLVAFSFRRKGLGPVLGGVESKSGNEIRLKPPPTHVPARSASGPRLGASLSSGNPGRMFNVSCGVVAMYVLLVYLVLCLRGALQITAATVVLTRVC